MREREFDLAVRAEDQGMELPMRSIGPLDLDEVEARIEAAERLFGDESTYWDKPELFLRRIFKVHKAALEELEKLVPLQAGRENGE